VEIDVPDVEGARLLVAARVQAIGHPAQGLPDNTRLQCRYELSYTPLGAAVVGEALQVPEDPIETPGPGVAPESAAQPMETSSREQTGSPGAHSGASAAPEPPVIRAVYRNKQPVRMEQEIAAHERREWISATGDVG
jgi:hypothetical protein